MLYAILKPIAVALMRLLFRLEVVSAEHGARHRAGADRVQPRRACSIRRWSAARAPRQLFFLAKEELFRVPLFGRLIRA